MNDRVNKKIPYDKEGVVIHSKLDELMMQYYRVPNGEDGGALHVEAFEVGQKLQSYFATYSVVTVNEMLEGKKLTFPDREYAMQGLECPFTLMLDNKFFQDNFPSLIMCILAEITRMNSSRHLSKKESAFAYAASLCKWEYLSVIAGLVAGTKSQKQMDIALRENTMEEMDNIMKSISEAMKKGK